MPTDLTIKMDEQEFPLDTDEVLRGLTGAETIMLEEYLGGWENFTMGGGSTRSVIVTIWLARRQAGLVETLQDIEGMKGLVFGDRVDVVEEAKPGPPAAGGETPFTPSEASDDSGPGTTPKDGA